jgi:hypothetical protein
VVAGGGLALWRATATWPHQNRGLPSKWVLKPSDVRLFE